jgi:hypothetical protein
MKLNIFIFCLILHFGLSLGAFLGLNGWAAGVQDAGTFAPAAAWAELPLHFILLQPLAHWVLAAVAIRWWTWPGLATVAVLFGLNSTLAVSVVWGLAGRLRGSKARGRPHLRG